MAINYLNQGIDYINKIMKPKELNHISMLVKGHNYLALAYMKSGKINISQQMFKKS